MRDQRQVTRRRCRSIILWGLGLFLASQLVLLATMVWWRPEVGDPEFGFRLTRLRKKLEERQPGQPLVLALGSSRTAYGLRPDAIADRPGAPLLFNFGMVGAGPLMELVWLRRLLDSGVRPDLVLVEVWPPFWGCRGPIRETRRMEIDRLIASDLAVLEDYFPPQEGLSRQWFVAQLTPWYTHRFKLMNLVAPRWLPFQRRKDHCFRGLDPWGWLPGEPVALTGQRHEEKLAKVRDYFLPVFRQFRVDEAASQAMCDILQLCRDRDVRAALVYLPEGREFQELYTRGANFQSVRILSELQQEYEVPLVNARDWAASDHFVDSFHLLTSGAAAFTERLDREAIRPLLTGGELP